MTLQTSNASNDDATEQTMYAHLDTALTAEARRDECQRVGDSRQARVYDGMRHEHEQQAFSLDRLLRSKSK